MNATLLSVQNGDFSFAAQTVLKKINLKITKGEFVGIIGPNGAGKSTLLRLLAGILKLDSGSVTLQNKDITAYERRRLAREIAYVPQSVEMAFPFQVQEVLRMGRYPHLKGVQDEDRRSSRVIDQALKQLDLEKLRSRSYRSLSGGEKQRAIIASALAQETPLILLDEPTSALDLKHQQKILNHLSALQKEQGKTIIFVTHDINLAAQFCRRLVLLSEGQILADGPPDQVLQFALIQQVYGVKVYIDINPFTDSLYILPYAEE